eukprot:15342650-Ditylum_brightwellii.AAC.1
MKGVCIMLANDRYGALERKPNKKYEPLDGRRLKSLTSQTTSILAVGGSPITTKHAKNMKAYILCVSCLPKNEAECIRSKIKLKE